MCPNGFLSEQAQNQLESVSDNGERCGVAQVCCSMPLIYEYEEEYAEKYAEKYCEASEECVEADMCGDDGSVIVTDFLIRQDEHDYSDGFCPRDKVCCTSPLEVLGLDVEAVCTKTQSCVDAASCDNEGFEIEPDYDYSNLGKILAPLRKFQPECTHPKVCCSPRPQPCALNEKCVNPQSCDSEGNLAELFMVTMNIHRKFGADTECAHPNVCCQEVKPEPVLCTKNEECMSSDECDAEGFLDDYDSTLGALFSSGEEEAEECPPPHICCKVKEVDLFYDGANCEEDEECVEDDQCNDNGSVVDDAPFVFRQDEHDYDDGFCPEGRVCCKSPISDIGWHGEICSGVDYRCFNVSSCADVQDNIPRLAIRKDAGAASCDIGFKCCLKPDTPPVGGEICDMEDHDCYDVDSCDDVLFDERSGQRRGQRKAEDDSRCAENYRCCPNPAYPSEAEYKCGVHNSELTEKAIRALGQSAAEGEWPYVCMLHTAKGFKGAATLIAPGIVLTGAHYSGTDPTAIWVICGVWDGSKDSEPGRQTLNVARIIQHPEFIGKNKQYHNVALLFMERDFRMTRHVSPICLDTPYNSYDPMDCQIAGWGKQSLNDSKKIIGSGQLQIVDQMPITNKTYCQDQLRKTRLGNNFKLHNSFVCAGGEINGGTCKGDGGGPLFCYKQADYYDDDEEETWVQAGIISWGIGCNYPGRPDVFADVTKGFNGEGEGGLCFIHAAAKCYDPKYESYFGVQGCGSSWWQDQTERLGREIANERRSRFRRKIQKKKRAYQRVLDSCNS
jgi:hypothetical protein